MAHCCHSVLGCYYKPETKTCENGSADLVVAKSETQLICTVSSRNYIAKLHREAVEDRSKRQLPTTITPEGSDVRKKRLESDSEQPEEKSPERIILKRPCFQKAQQCAIRGTQNRKLIETLTQTPHLHSLDKMPIFCLIIASKIEDIKEKPNTQLNVLILNPNGEVIEREMFDNVTQDN